jgi:hypothetical protein
LDATDHPVNGFFDITYRVFEAPSGGAPFWTEVHASVQVTDGLFSALLGSTVPLSADVLGGGGSGGALAPPRYLEVTVGGTTLTPRLALSSVPSALSSSHVTGDIETSPGRVLVSNIGSSGNDGVELLALPTGSSVAIKEKGTGADPRRSITSTTNPETATTILAADLDGDGVMDNTSADSVGTGGASRRLAVHNLGSSGQDGVEVKWAARPKGGTVKITATHNL